MTPMYWGRKCCFVHICSCEHKGNSEMVSTQARAYKKENSYKGSGVNVSSHTNLWRVVEGLQGLLMEGWLTVVGKQIPVSFLALHLPCGPF